MNWTEEPYQWNSPPYTIILADRGYNVWYGKIGADEENGIGWCKTLAGAKAIAEADAQARAKKPDAHGWD